MEMQPWKEFLWEKREAIVGTLILGAVGLFEPAIPGWVRMTCVAVLIFSLSA